MEKDFIQGKTLHYNLGEMQKLRDDINNLISPMIDDASSSIMNFFKKYSKGFISQNEMSKELINDLKEKEEHYFLMFSGFFPFYYKKYYKAISDDSKRSIERNVKFIRNKYDMVPQSWLHLPSNDEEILDDISSPFRSIFNDFFMGIVSYYFYKISKKSLQYSLNEDGTGLRNYLSSQRRITRNIVNRGVNNNYRSTFNKISKNRMNAMGMKLWKWIYTYRSKTPRPFHMNVLNGQIFDFNKKPPLIDPLTKDHGFPGDLPNCKCRMRPIYHLKGI